MILMLFNSTTDLRIAVIILSMFFLNFNIEKEARKACQRVESSRSQTSSVMQAQIRDFLDAGHVFRLYRKTEAYLSEFSETLVCLSTGRRELARIEIVKVLKQAVLNFAGMLLIVWIFVSIFSS